MNLLQSSYKFKRIVVSDSLESCIYLRIKSMEAVSGPPIGPSLGQYGIPAAQFCKDFNDRSSIFNSEVELFVTIFLYKSGSYVFSIDFPSFSFFLKKALNIDFFVKKPGYIRCGRKWLLNFFPDVQIRSRRQKVISAYMLYEILIYKTKFEILRIDSASDFKRSIGTLRSMGILLDFDEYTLE